MSRTALETVRRVKDQRQQSAARALGDQQRALAEQEARLAQLMNHREHYRTLLHHLGGQGLDARQLGEYRAFLQRLETAIAQQRHRIQQSRARLQQCRDAWLACRQEVEAIDQLVNRRAQRQRQHQARLEQNENDDLAANRRAP